MKKIFLTSIAALALAACGAKEDAAAPAPGTSDQAAEQTSAAAPYTPDEKTYFKLPAAAGGELDLASYAGKPVMVLFFTETCPYCRKAAPFIQSINAAYGKKGLNVIGVCTQDSKQAALNFTGDFKLSFPVAYSGGPVAKRYETRGVPYIFLLDRNHKIAETWIGYSPEYDKPITDAVEAMLGKN